MKEKLILIIKGFIIGIGKIIPGVSGAMLAICLNVYDKGLEAITNYFKDIKGNTKFLFYLMIGFVLGIIMFSRIIYYLLTKYFFLTMLFFIGLLLGGTINIYKNITKKNYLLIIITFIILFFPSIGNINNNYMISNNMYDYIIFALGGLLDAIATVVPGISGMALLSILGIYDTVILSISNFTNLNLMIPFTIFFIIGIEIISVIINKLLKKHPNNTYSIIIGIIISSIILLFIKTFSYNYNILELIMGIILVSIGYIISKYLDK